VNVRLQPGERRRPASAAVAVWAGIVVYHWQHMQPQKTEAVDLTYFHKANLWGTYVGYRRFLVNVLLDVVVGIVLWHLKDLLWPPPRPTWWRALLAGPGLAFLFVAFLELSVRHYDSLPHGDYRVDPVLGWSLARRHDVNRFGLRGPEIAAEKAPGEVRILCLGDSCTYGSGTQVSETWPARLQVHLAALLPSAKVTVLNGGVPGYNSAHGVHALRRYLFLKPDLVIWSFTANDAYEMPYQPPSQTDGPLLALLRQRPGREVIPHPKRRETHAHASVLRRVRPRLPFLHIRDGRRRPVDPVAGGAPLPDPGGVLALPPGTRRGTYPHPRRRRLPRHAAQVAAPPARGEGTARGRRTGRAAGFPARPFALRHRL